jgi:hypothetical protein
MKRPSLRDAIEAKHIGHLRFTHVSQIVTERIDAALAGSEPKFQAIAGPSRVGKSALMAELKARYNVGTDRRVLFVDAPEAPSPQLLPISVLNALRVSRLTVSLGGVAPAERQTLSLKIQKAVYRCPGTHDEFLGFLGLCLLHLLELFDRPVRRQTVRAFQSFNFGQEALRLLQVLVIGPCAVEQRRYRGTACSLHAQAALPDAISQVAPGLVPLGPGSDIQHLNAAPEKPTTNYLHEGRAARIRDRGALKLIWCAHCARR